MVNENIYSRTLDIKSVYDGDVTRALIYASEFEPRKHVVRAALAFANAEKGGRLHYHQNTDEIYLIIEGQAIVEIDGNEFVVSPMGCVQIPRKTKHRIRATDNGAIKYIALHVSDVDFNGPVLHCEV
ncbi:cupin domain-containing protein [Salmonella enterica]